MEIKVKKTVTKKQLIKKAYNKIGLKGNLKQLRSNSGSEINKYDLRFKIVRKDCLVEVEGIRTIYEEDESWDDAYNWNVTVEFINKEGEEDSGDLDVCSLDEIKGAVIKLLEAHKKT